MEEISLLKAAVGDGEAFLTSTAPASVEVYRENEYYDTEEEFLFAVAEALKEEYELIASAGLLVQVDDAWLPALWDRIGLEMGLEAFRDRCMLRIEALNHALARIPEDQIRYHLCWGSWHGPHAYDLEMRHIVDLMLRVKAGAYLFEAGNARHEHEYEIWDDVALPEGKILVPGVISHSTDVIEHPELVSQRIQRFASRVGRENVIAGADCGFGAGRIPTSRGRSSRRSSRGPVARASPSPGVEPGSTASLVHRTADLPRPRRSRRGSRLSPERGGRRGRGRPWRSPTSRPREVVDECDGEVRDDLRDVRLGRAGRALHPPGDDGRDLTATALCLLTAPTRGPYRGTLATGSRSNSSTSHRSGGGRSGADAVFRVGSEEHGGVVRRGSSRHHGAIA